MVGLAKVLFGKEPGLSKCVRVDSLGLAKRRLAAKAAQEEHAIGEPDVDEPVGVAPNDLELSPEQDPVGESGQDDTDNIIMVLGNRQHRDSLRIHRRRFRQRASLELPRSRLQHSLRDKGTSWSSGNSQSGPGCEVDDENEEGVAAERHVRFRRASDGEYLTQPSSKSLESSLPNALKLVQLKAERLFKRLTAPFAEHPPRPRSSTPSRGGSPNRSHRNSSSRAGSTGRSTPSWAQGLRHRSVDAGVASGASPSATSPSAAAVAAAATIANTVNGVREGRTSAAGDGRIPAGAGFAGLRAKRTSAPGELFYPVVGNCGSAAPIPGLGANPAEAHSGACREGTATGASPAGGLSKGRNWLARLSRGFSAATAGGSGGGGSGSHARPVSQPTVSPPPSPPPTAAAQKVSPKSDAPAPDCSAGVVEEQERVQGCSSLGGASTAAAPEITAATANAEGGAVVAASGSDAGGEGCGGATKPVDGALTTEPAASAASAEVAAGTESTATVETGAAATAAEGAGPV